MNEQQMRDRELRWAFVDYSCGEIGKETYGRLITGRAHYFTRDEIHHVSRWAYWWNKLTGKPSHVRKELIYC